MKYKMVRADQEVFIPFTVSLTFETKEEYVHFHDHVMGLLNKEVANHNFYGAVYGMGNGETDYASGEFEMVKSASNK